VNQKDSPYLFRNINRFISSKNCTTLSPMDGFNIVMVIAIILFARLGVRLVTGYIKMKKEDKDDTNDNTVSKQE
jgi:hypothetical protein